MSADNTNRAFVEDRDRDPTATAVTNGETAEGDR